MRIAIFRGDGGWILVRNCITWYPYMPPVVHFPISCLFQTENRILSWIFLILACFSSGCPISQSALLSQSVKAKANWWLLSAIEPSYFPCTRMPYRRFWRLIEVALTIYHQGNWTIQIGCYVDMFYMFSSYLWRYSDFYLPSSGEIPDRNSPNNLNY